MDPLYALDVVNGFIQFAVSHKNCPDPTVPYVLLSGPIHTFYESVRNEPFFTELSTPLSLKWEELSLTGLAPEAFDIKTLTEQMLLQLQRDYGKQLSRSLQSWVFKGDRVPHNSIALTWSIGGYKAITETGRVRCASSAATQITATA